MSDSKSNAKKIEFETKKKLLGMVFEDITCFGCKTVPREAPIHQTFGRKIICDSCSKKWDPESFILAPVALEILLLELPRPCKFKKSGCKIAMELKSIEYHEEDCIFRDIQCFYNDCDEIHPYENLSEHLKSKHNFEIFGEKFRPVTKICKIECRISIPNERKSKFAATLAAFEQFQMTFVPQVEIDDEKNHTLVWLMIYGSQFEAINFEYTMECEDVEFGTFSYKNYLKSLDDNRKDICKSMACLIVPSDMFWKDFGGEFVLKITIENLKEEEPEPDFNDEEIVSPLAKENGK